VRLLTEMKQSLKGRKRTPSPPELQTATEPEELLTAFLRRNGCIRLPNKERQLEGHQIYKKGAEVRLVARSKKELMMIRRLLRQVRLRPGSPYPNGHQFVQPVYSQQAVDWFRSLLNRYPARNQRHKQTPDKPADQ
jgi:hypothetical protein